jgi:hypothetical protein
LRQLGEPRIVCCGNVLQRALWLRQVQSLQRLGEDAVPLRVVRLIR